VPKDGAFLRLFSERVQPKFTDSTILLKRSPLVTHSNSIRSRYLEAGHQRSRATQCWASCSCSCQSIPTRICEISMRRRVQHWGPPRRWYYEQLLGRRPPGIAPYWTCCSHWTRVVGQHWCWCSSCWRICRISLTSRTWRYARCPTRPRSHWPDWAAG